MLRRLVMSMSIVAAWLLLSGPTLSHGQIPPPANGVLDQVVDTLDPDPTPAPTPPAVAITVLACPNQNFCCCPAGAVAIAGGGTCPDSVDPEWRLTAIDYGPVDTTDCGSAGGQAAVALCSNQVGVSIAPALVRVTCKMP